MEPEQLEFEGFCHTGEFRRPMGGEWFQPNAVGLVITPLRLGDFRTSIYEGAYLGKRWILTLNSGVITNQRSLREGLEF